ncbi:MAG: hypothetical protein ABJB16_14915 [Saprospiraceae bacterium]
MNIKVIIVTTVLLLLRFCSFSQQGTLDDFWKDVEKRKGLNKINKEALTVKYDSKLIKICGNNIIILQQDYVYEKKNKRYVKGSDDYYGRKFGVGIRTEEGIIASKHLIDPWNRDSSSLILKGYAPVRTSVHYMSVLDTVTAVQEEGKYSLSGGDHLIRYSFDQIEKDENKGVQPDSTGLLMLFYQDMENDSIKRIIVDFNPKWTGDGAVIDTQWINRQLIGGVYFNADSTVAKSNFIITGILGSEMQRGFKLYKLINSIPEKSSGKSEEFNELKNTSKNDCKSITSDKKRKKKNNKS